MRNKCLYCGRKRENKFMIEISKEIQQITSARNTFICSREVKFYNDSTCIEKFAEQQFLISIKKSARLKKLLTEVKTSPHVGQKNKLQINLIDVINDIENELK